MSNSVLRQAASLSCEKEFWLGGSYDTEIPNQWSWTDERRFSYKNWAAGQPANQDNYCTALDVSSGGWFSRACNATKPYICKVPPSGAHSVSTTSAPRQRSTTKAPRKTCRDGWTYVNHPVGKCIRITDHEDYWPNMWTECKHLGGDLVSIPDNATNYALIDFAYQSLGMGDHDFNWLVIGLYKPTVNDPWQWTDGTPVNFTNWADGYDGGPQATITFLGVFGQKADDYDWRNGYWEGHNSSDISRLGGICESEPV